MKNRMVKKRGSKEKIEKLRKEQQELNKQLNPSSFNVIKKIFKRPEKQIKKEKPEILATKVKIKEPRIKKTIPEEKTKFRFEGITIKKTLITLIILAFLFFNFYYFGLFKGTCDDLTCFNEALTDCKPVKFTRIRDNNFYEYNIYKSLGSSCQLKITLEKAAPGSTIDIVELLEDKSMTCKIPKSILVQKNYDDIENVLDYCHGELKEGVLQLIIKRMYSLVITDLDEIVKQAQNI